LSIHTFDRSLDNHGSYVPATTLDSCNRLLPRWSVYFSFLSHRLSEVWSYTSKRKHSNRTGNIEDSMNRIFSSRNIGVSDFVRERRSIYPISDQPLMLVSQLSLQVTMGLEHLLKRTHREPMLFVTFVRTMSYKRRFHKRM